MKDDEDDADDDEEEVGQQTDTEEYDDPPAAAASQPTAPVAGAFCSPKLFVLVLSNREGYIRRVLQNAGLERHCTVMSLGSRDYDSDELKDLLSRQPLVAPQAGSSQMACLWIVDFDAKDDSRLDEYRSKLTTWVERGGMLMMHGKAAPVLLRRWFRTRWKNHQTIKRAELHAAQLSLERSVNLLPSGRLLPKEIVHESRCVSDVAPGDAVYRGVAGLCPVALSEYGTSQGGVGFVGAIKMWPVLVGLVNRQWTPPRAVKSGPCTSVKSFLEFANQCPDPKRKHLLSVVAGHVPAGWTQRQPAQGCVHSCCVRRSFASGETLRGHASNESLHANCDKSTCAIWKDSQVPIAAAAASSSAAAAAAAPQLPRVPSQDSSSSSAAAASAMPRPLIPVLAPRLEVSSPDGKCVNLRGDCAQPFLCLGCKGELEPALVGLGATRCPDCWIKHKCGNVGCTQVDTSMSMHKIFNDDGEFQKQVCAACWKKQKAPAESASKCRKCKETLSPTCVASGSRSAPSATKVLRPLQ